MKKYFNKSMLISRLFLLLMVGALAFGTGACKSKKKLAEEAAAREYADKVEQAIAELKAILNDDGTMPVTEQERRLNDVKAQNLNDTRVNELIKLVEEKIAAQKEEERLRAEEERKKQEAMEDQSDGFISEYFDKVAYANSVAAANQRIDEALKLFASPDTPVLIIISQAGGITDYDKPTTIQKYLNYLKDTRNNPNRISSVKKDGYGQITAIELIKK